MLCSGRRPEAAQAQASHLQLALGLRPQQIASAQGRPLGTRLKAASPTSLNLDRVLWGKETSGVLWFFPVIVPRLVLLVRFSKISRRWELYQHVGNRRHVDFVGTFCENTLHQTDTRHLGLGAGVRLERTAGAHWPRWEPGRSLLRLEVLCWVPVTVTGGPLGPWT